MCDSVKAAADTTGKLNSDWLEKEILRFRKILKLYGSCHSVFNSSKELTAQDICSFSKLSKGKTLKLLHSCFFYLVDKILRIKF